MSTEFNKNPSARLDYQVDWSAWLGTDTIASVLWTIPAGLTQNAASATATAATIWLSGGTPGGEYRVTCQITTAGGRTDRRGFTILTWDL